MEEIMGKTRSAATKIKTWVFKWLNAHLHFFQAIDQATYSSSRCQPRQLSAGQVRPHVGLCVWHWQDTSPTRSKVILDISGIFLGVCFRQHASVHERKAVIRAKSLDRLSDYSLAIARGHRDTDGTTRTSMVGLPDASRPGAVPGQVQIND